MNAFLAATGASPPPYLILPFAVLLVAIATMPLIAKHFWERHYPSIAAALGIIPVAYYLFALHQGGRVLHSAWEYVSFIVFIGSIFTVAGGIHIRVQGEATPAVNLGVLAFGGLLANLIGTTGASMLLIRPWIRMNKYRFTDFHACFFIFIVSNVGGCLTPVGDPPLFLGYLKGIPFFWITLRFLPAWALAMVLLLGIFYVLDCRNFRRAPAEVSSVAAHREFRVDGLSNIAWFALILGAVFIKAPPGLREALMLVAAFGSYKTTARSVHQANHFDFAPIAEVAWLFAGLFATMMPAVDFLEQHAEALGIREPAQFYWITGGLSAVLDNAPTYITFLAAAFGLHGLNFSDPADMARFLAEHPAHVMAISLGAVFFGAATYLGNGPNFMVKAICDRAEVHSPGFFAYLARFAVPILLPILALIGWLFF